MRRKRFLNDNCGCSNLFTKGVNENPIAVVLDLLNDLQVLSRNQVEIEREDVQRIASEHCTFIGDRTQARGLGTCGYDDDGVKTSEFTIIDKGIFRNYQTTREQAILVGDKESHGCCQADSWATVPFQRMPNVWLKPGPKETTMEDLIAGIDDGVLIDGRGSYSIDQQRYNFQFGGDAFWEIKGGKKGNMISRVSYQARTPDFWQACDGTAGPAYWRQFGTTGDAKGEPTQINSALRDSAIRAAALSPRRTAVSTLTGCALVATAAEAMRSAVSAYSRSIRMLPTASSGAGSACCGITATNRSGTSRLTASSIAHSAARMAACEPSMPTTIGNCGVVDSRIAITHNP